MIDYIKVTWKCYDEYGVIRDNKFEIFHSHEEADAFIDKLKNSPNTITYFKTTCEFFRVNKMYIDKSKGL
jgi:hypothetical protein